MADSFYTLTKPAIKTVKGIFTWGKGQATQTDVDMLDCKKSFARVRADKTLDQVMALIDKSAIGFFSMVIREKEMSHFGVREDVLELFIRSIDVGDVEYFIFMHLPVDKLQYLLENYSFRKK